MLGETFEGLTDRLLCWQEEQLLLREIAHEGHIVHVRPKLVVSIAFNDVQTSSQYAAPKALRLHR
jgi:DNA ligase-1